jgi:hypothetical protein
VMIMTRSKKITLECQNAPGGYAGNSRQDIRERESRTE